MRSDLKFSQHHFDSKYTFDWRLKKNYWVQLQPQYADTSLAMNKTESKGPPSAQAYMDLGPGGRRTGERSRSEES